jgi:copper oxidase (laccase) domain-containing protein
VPFQYDQLFNPNTLRSARYGFFTNEQGNSSGGYVVSGRPTRNVNLFSPQDKEKVGFDPALSVIENVMACFKELTSDRQQRAHKFLMTSKYGKDGARVLLCRTQEEISALKRLAIDERVTLGLHVDMQEGLSQNDIYVVKADAMVFKGLPGELIACGGASGDAHPIILVDDENKVCAYVAGAHAALREGVVEKTIYAMLEAGAQPKKIHLLIGPGLGKYSYEFGMMRVEDKDVTPEKYLNIPADKVTLVQDPQKRLIDIEKVVAFKAMGLVAPENIHNMNVDTMGFDLYDAQGARKSTVSFQELNRNGALFFSARRTIMEREGLDAYNPGLYNTVGRHFAGVEITG